MYRYTAHQQDFAASCVHNHQPNAAAKSVGNNTQAEIIFRITAFRRAFVDVSAALRHDKVTPGVVKWLIPVLTEIILWSAKYDENTAADANYVEMAKSNRSALHIQVLGKLG